MSDDLRRLRHELELLDMRVMTLEIRTDSLRLARDTDRAADPEFASTRAELSDALVRAAATSAELSENLKTYVRKLGS